MRYTKSVMAGLALALVGGMAGAEPKVYPYATSENYCPNGLQPITLNGVICCGTPNQNQTYQQVMAHPVSKKRYKTHKVRRARMVDTCPEGVKGCY